MCGLRGVGCCFLLCTCAFCFKSQDGIKSYFIGNLRCASTALGVQGLTKAHAAQPPSPELLPQSVLTEPGACVQGCPDGQGSDAVKGEGTHSHAVGVAELHEGGPTG